ncbi:MAG: PBECR2 nuclease fold domain-containing protein [Candidatus Pacearchaeota archaeon]|nr:PBECR2 nuclease fold domain-containing protein [Candidatus Pacearchaeota archaeon]
MLNIFEVIDKTGRKIRLTQEQLVHILRHKGMEQHLEDIKQILINPQKVILRSDGETADYYLYFKYRKSPSKYLQVTVKYLNGDGFIITAYFVKDIH